MSLDKVPRRLNVGHYPPQPQLKSELNQRVLSKDTESLYCIYYFKNTKQKSSDEMF